MQADIPPAEGGRSAGTAPADAARIARLAEARICPPLDRNLPGDHPAVGVFDADGAFFHPANVERDGAFEIRPRTLRHTPARRLAGRHLYGGQLNHHFGHFLCESLARLWPLANGTEEIGSVLMLPRRSGSETGLKSFHREVFGLLGLPAPVKVVDEPMIVEELVVPEQGFGVARLSPGTAAFRAYMRSRFATDIAPEGPEKLYIARTGLPLRKGSMVGERTLAKRLRDEGYEIFSPENHTIRTQVARYKAARRIVAIEGSALHLYGFVGTAEQEVAVIARRSDLVAARGIAAQIEHFCERAPLLIDAVGREWDTANGPVRSSKSIAELNLPEARARLAEAGFVAAAKWSPVSDEHSARQIERVERRVGRKLHLCERPPGPAG